MYRYILKRFLLMIPIVLGVSFVIFTILSVTPSDPASIILGTSATQEEIDALNHQLGYDAPFLVRYFSYLGRVILHFDFGSSYINGQPVMKNILSKLPVSFSVAFNAIACASIIGIPLGVLSAVKQYSAIDTTLTVQSLLFASAPGFVIGMLLLLIFSLRLKWLPSFGIDSWKSYVLPMFSLGIPYAAQQFRFTRSSMLETIRTDYVRTARAKGAPEKRVIWKHALKNALLPIITVIGVNFGALLGGAIVIENLFSIPGLGTFIVTGIKQKDMPVVMGGSIVLAIMFSLIMLAVDLLYAAVDPRIKAKYSGKR